MYDDLLAASPGPGWAHGPAHRLLLSPEGSRRAAYMGAGEVTPVDVARAHDSFQSPLIVEYVDGRTWIVREPFTYVSPRVALTIPIGFRTDFASIPRVLWRWISPTDKEIGKPSIVHDAIYRTPDLLFTRSQADTELREAMNCVGASAFKRWAVYQAVRRFGGHSYKPRDSDVG